MSNISFMPEKLLSNYPCTPIHWVFSMGSCNHSRSISSKAFEEYDLQSEYFNANRVAKIEAKAT